MSMKEKYPSLFSDDFIGESIPKGWVGIVDDLCSKIENHVAETGSSAMVIQIKEKFGELRFYCQGDDAVISMISEAENLSKETCVVTGKTGKPRVINGWMTVLCDEEYQKRIGQN